MIKNALKGDEIKIFTENEVEKVCETVFLYSFAFEYNQTN